MGLALEIGPGGLNDGIARPAGIWRDVTQVETLDGEAANNPTYVHNLCDPIPDELHSRYDYVLASHVLEHIPRPNVAMAMQNITLACKPGGEIAILVPSLEWAARQILIGNNGMDVQGVIFGGQRPGNQFDVHYAGYTMASLNALARAYQLEVLRSGHIPYGIEGYGKVYRVESHFIVMKKGEGNDVHLL